MLSLPVNQGGADSNRYTQHESTNEPWSETKNQVDLTYFVEFLGHR